MRRTLAATAALALALGLGMAGSAPAASAPVTAPAAAPYCGITWGSTPKAHSVHTSRAQVTGARTARHTCYDRMVIDLKHKVTGFNVRYVDRVTEDGSGRPVPLAGGADLHVVVYAAAYDENVRPTYLPRDRDRVADVDGYRTFRQVAFAGSFEGQTTFGLGVRAQLPFRAFILDGPGGGSRVVVDVAHRW